MISLPIDPFLPGIVDAVHTSRAVVVTAAPGAGKTTRVPPALVGDGPVIVLQPRRVAARAIAQRIAEERRWTIGREVGWQVRFERRFGPDTSLLVATEGILTARFQQDPLLSSFRTIVLDEFHERSIHADLAIALAKQAWHARPDLRIVVMSATLDARAVAAFLDDCPVIEVPGQLHPLDVTYAAGQTVADGAAELIGRGGGGVLCFLPGAFEIRRAMAEIETRLGKAIDVMPLYGALESSEQDLALRESTGSRQRIVVATNIAETSLTVPGVTAVVDTGLQKVARYDADRAIDSLTTERITADSADQRAGRAGRVAPGLVRRLWDARDRLRPHREPEIHRVDLSSTVIDVIAWGGDPRRLDWFDRPRPEAIDAAFGLLERLGAVRAGTLTDVGRRMAQLPIHPRLARMLIGSDGMRAVAQACALLSERHFFAARSASTTSDLLSAIDGWSNVPPHVVRAAEEIEQLYKWGRVEFSAGTDFTNANLHGLKASLTTLPSRRGGSSRTEKTPPDTFFRRAIFAGYPDRVAQRREPGSPRVKLASGAGATVGPQSGVRDGEFLVAVDVQAPARPNDPDSVVRVASRVEREWLEPNAIETVHRFDDRAGVVRAYEVERYDALVLVERPAMLDPEVAARLLTDAYLARAMPERDVRLARRLRFAGHAADIASLIRVAAYRMRSLEDLRLQRAVSPETLRSLDRDAPEMLEVPSGRAVPLHYEDDGSVTASVKLQELFGLADTPRVGPGREPVRFALLAPNGRPVQMTTDLRSFWERTYPEVRKELRGRYPKHPWPEDPWTAKPTARTTRRRT